MLLLCPEKFFNITIRENKISLKYYYKDKNGDYLFSFTLTPDQYEN